ncbi:MAG: hypothetical protein U9R17_06960 [Thermodesulfobacteriota bacterium]|nr:hypothetical protein [Thermodesulfobacteriota bacterium]
MLNLEPICARYGHCMINKVESLQDQENTITKALGVLSENGLYAMCIFLLSCHKKDYGNQVLTEHLRGLWQEDGIEIIPRELESDPGRILHAVQKVSEELPKLILARKVTEQALIFARYHAKAGVPSIPKEG